MDTSFPGTFGGEVSFGNSDTAEDPFNFTILGEVASITAIDDSDSAGFNTTGVWTSVNRNGNSGGFQYAAPGNGESTARWSFAVDPGEYRILTSYHARTNRASNAPFTICDEASLIATVALNQRIPPNDELIEGRWFEELGSYTIIGSQLTVELNDLADDVVIADVIRLQRI